LAALCVGCYHALGYAERYLSETKHCHALAALASLAFVLTVLIGHAPRYRGLYRLGFAASAMPRLEHEAAFLLNVYGAQADEVKAIARTEQRLANMLTDLARLGGSNVHLILVESYGQTSCRSWQWTVESPSGRLRNPARRDRSACPPSRRLPSTIFLGCERR
jgi:hypothetical protein